ncbi:hypothetical protein TCAL_16527 [Tigriopus californicus]|uniref:Uncharacterized protein n=1 Tax=Tigriopus californicus TaxID=6832 RepID=A0A553NV11_TIGCA|nr:hypothetical protein TCAL_16527 [Tigriopus californicus]
MMSNGFLGLFIMVLTILTSIINQGESKYLLVKLEEGTGLKARPSANRARPDPKVLANRWIAGNRAPPQPFSTYGADLGDQPQYNMQYW